MDKIANIGLILVPSAGSFHYAKIKMGSRKVEKNHPSNPENEAELSYPEMMEMVNCLPDASWKKWDEDKKRIWNEFVTARRDFEVEAIKMTGCSAKKTEKLVQIEWVTWGEDCGGLVLDKFPAGDSSISVPVVMVSRNGRFEIEGEIHRCIDCHPLQALPEGYLIVRDEKANVLRSIEEVDAIAEENGLDYMGLSHLRNAVSDQDGRSVRITECGFAAYRFRLLLEHEFFDGESDEDLESLAVGKRGRRLWKLLETAIYFGEVMERHRILDVRKGEEAMMRMITTPPGKNTGEAGEAIELMIESYQFDKGRFPTALSLIRWLGSDRTGNSDAPLKVDHPLWTDVMQTVTWPQLQQLVKDAKKRMKKR